MYGAITPFSQYAVMAWCSVRKESTGTNLPSPFYFVAEYLKFVIFSRAFSAILYYSFVLQSGVGHNLMTDIAVTLTPCHLKP
jgi:hypothetical protein